MGGRADKKFSFASFLVIILEASTIYKINMLFTMIDSLCEDHNVHCMTC